MRRFSPESLFSRLSRPHRQSKEVPDSPSPLGSTPPPESLRRQPEWVRRQFHQADTFLKLLLADTQPEVLHQLFYHQYNTECEVREITAPSHETVALRLSGQYPILSPSKNSKFHQRPSHQGYMAPSLAELIAAQQQLDVPPHTRVLNVSEGQRWFIIGYEKSVKKVIAFPVLAQHSAEVLEPFVDFVPHLDPTLQYLSFSLVDKLPLDQLWQSLLGLRQQQQRGIPAIGDGIALGRTDIATIIGLGGQRQSARAGSQTRRVPEEELEPGTLPFPVPTPV